MLPVLIVFSLYAVFHSFLAGRGKLWFRDWFGERTYHGLYRVFYNIVAVVTLLPVIYLMACDPGPILWSLPISLEPFLVFVQITGILGVAISLIQIDLLRFLGLKQLYAYISGAPLPLPSERLQTRGMYALVRHPLYLFALMLSWPVMTMTSAYFGYCVVLTTYFVFGSIYEERRMMEYYGQTYLDYRSRIPRLVPFLNISKGFVDKT